MGYVPPPPDPRFCMEDMPQGLQAIRTRKVVQITDTAGKPKQLLSGSSGQVLQLVGGMPTWRDVPPEQPAPTKGPLVLRCGACGTKHVANTKRCDACGCADRMEDISEPKLEAIIQKRRDYFSVFRRAFKPFSGRGTESSGPC